MYTLVRDSWPKLAEEANVTLNYAVIQNKELFIAFLRQKLADEVNEFLNAERMTLDKLVDIELILTTLRSESEISDEDFKNAYNDSIEKLGKFDNKYIMFYADPKTDNNAEAVDSNAPEVESAETEAKQ